MRYTHHPPLILLAASIASLAPGCGHTTDDTMATPVPMYWIQAVHITGHGGWDTRRGALLDAVCIHGERDMVCATELIPEFTHATRPEQALGEPNGQCGEDADELPSSPQAADIQIGDSVRVGFGRELPIYKGDKLVLYSTEYDSDRGPCEFGRRDAWFIDRDGGAARVFASGFRTYKVLDHTLDFTDTIQP